MVSGAYFITVEGAEWVNEIFLDLLVKHPHGFLMLVSQQEDEVRKKVVKELLSPVTDKYSHRELLAAVGAAQAQGLRSTFLQELIDFYSIPEPGR